MIKIAIFCFMCLIMLIPSILYGQEISPVDAILTHIRDSEIIFIRNGERYTASQAYDWLKWKVRHRQYLKRPIMTRQDFIQRVADRSKKTGEPYWVVTSEGKTIRLQKWLKGG